MYKIEESPEMLYSTLHKFIPPLFEIKQIFPVPKKIFEDEQSSSSQLKIYQYWTMSLQYFRPDFAYDEFVISIIETNQGIKSVIIIPPKFQSKTNSDYPLLSPITIPDNLNPQTQMMTTLELLMNLPANPVMGGKSFAFALWFGKFGTTFTANVSDRSMVDLETPILQPIWSSLISDIRNVAKLYKDKRLNDYIK